MDVRIELRHLQYVITAAERGSFRRAAKILGVQVSTLSRCVRDLEDEIGAALFLRGPHGVKLTFAGEHFVARARRAMAEVSKAIEEAGIAGTGRVGVIRLGVSSSLAAGFPAILIKIHQSVYSDVRLVYVEGGPADHVPAIQQHRLDVAFVPHLMTAEGCDAQILWNEQVFAVMARNDVLAEQDAVAWRDLRERRFIFSESSPGPEIKECLAERAMELGFRPKVELLTVYRDTLIQIVAHGSDVTLIGESRVTELVSGAVCRPIAEERLAFHAVWLPTNDNPALRRFLSLAKILSTRCAGCVFKNGLAGPADEGMDRSEGSDGDRNAERISRLSKIVSRRCAICLAQSGVME